MACDTAAVMFGDYFFLYHVKAFNLVIYTLMRFLKQCKIMGYIFFIS